ncbi:MAG: tail fiber domain-containing protein [Ferruginibacter sp.]
MRKLFILLLLVIAGYLSKAQSVGIGTTTPNSNAALEIRSNNKGLLMPRLSSAAKTSMTNVPKGMMVYDSTYSAFYYHDGGKWRSISEHNTDSLLLSDAINTPAVTANISGGNVVTTAISGILYDDGGPAANYSNNVFQTYGVSSASNDSIVGYKVIVEQMNLAAGDTLAIYVLDDPGHAVYFTGNKTGTYTFAASSDLGFVFLSNASGNAPGFKIRWGIITTSATVTDQAPFYGWYFNEKKIAVRGGISPVGYWISDSIGRLSFAYGNNAKAKGLNAIALGSQVSASGDFAAAIGFGSTASGSNSTAIGYIATASGNYATALGRYATASGQESFATGASTKAIGLSSTATGSQTTASGNYSTAMGSQTTASGINSMAAGLETTASNDYAIAMGNKTVASGNSSTAMGLSTTASGENSTSMGNSTTALGGSSVAMGNQTLAKSYGSLAIGRFNDDFGVSAGFWASGDPLFMIGNGSSNANRNNALVVLKNGNLGFGVNTPLAKMHIAGNMIMDFLSNTTLQMKADGVDKAFVQLSGDNLRLGTYSANNTATVIFRLNGADRFTINPNGNATISGTLTQNSDARFKRDIAKIENALDKVMLLNGYQYHWQNELRKDTSLQIGLIAQNVESVLPQLVVTDTEGQKSVAYQNMVPVLIEAIKEQQALIVEMKKEIETLKQKRAEK